MMPSDQAGSVRRRLSKEQHRALLDVRHRVNAEQTPREFMQHLVALISGIIQTKVGVVGKHDGAWVLGAESSSEPPIAILSNGTPHALDRLGATPGLRVELWRTEANDWTLVGLASEPGSPVILILEGDWTPCAAILRELAHSLSTGDRDVAVDSARTVDIITQHLTRALADTAGLAAVGEVVLHHVVQAVPSRMASLAVSSPEGELSIVATHGYPRALVEHLRISSGSGVIGAVHQSRVPLLVPDVKATPGLDRHRSRYRTSSFAAVPIVAGTEALGVVSLTDRIDPGPYTQDDLAAIALLMAPAALALGRERVWGEAQAYAQAAVIDPVSGLFNRRYFQARLDEELHRAVRQLTSVGLLKIGRAHV